MTLLNEKVDEKVVVEKAMSLKSALDPKKIYEVENVVVVPFCMTECLTGKDHGFYECTCNDCYVSNMRDIAQHYGFKTLLVGSETIIPTAKEFLEKGHKVKRVLGVICPEDIQSKTQKLGKENIPKVFENYDTFQIPKFCSGEGEETKVFKELKPELGFNEYKLLHEKLKILKGS